VSGTLADMLGRVAAKDLKAIIREAEKQGWRTRRTKQGHVMFYAPDGINKVTASGTSGDQKELNNLLAGLRRYGFKWKGR
jgi:predicted RNA binding protein YcfA (HicA-like mRNA interferase family)